VKLIREFSYEFTLKPFQTIFTEFSAHFGWKITLKKYLYALVLTSAILLTCININFFKSQERAEALFHPNFYPHLNDP
jgi:hypothetical protein